jgi:hypothetical protein
VAVIGGWGVVNVGRFRQSFLAKTGTIDFLPAPLQGQGAVMHGDCSSEHVFTTETSANPDIFFIYIIDMPGKTTPYCGYHFPFCSYIH